MTDSQGRVESQAVSTAIQRAGGDSGMDIDALKQSLMESAIKMAAIQLGEQTALEISLACVAPIGTIVAAVLAVIGLFTSHYAKNQIKEVVKNGVADIQRMTAQVQDAVMNAAFDQADALYPGAQALAAAGPLNDLGSWWTDAGRDVTNDARVLAQPIAPMAAKAIVYPHKWIGKAILGAGLIYARWVGDKQFEAKIHAKYGEWDEKSRSVLAQVTTLAADPVMMVRLMHVVPARELIGTQNVDDARKKVRALVQQAAQQLPALKARLLAAFQTDEFKTQLQINMAKLIQRDPTALAQATQAQQIDAAAQQTQDRALQAAANGQATI